MLSACDVSPSAIQGLARISNWVGQSGGEKEAENTEEDPGGDSVSCLQSHLSECLRGCPGDICDIFKTRCKIAVLWCVGKAPLRPAVTAAVSLRQTWSGITVNSYTLPSFILVHKRICCVILLTWKLGASAPLPQGHFLDWLRGSVKSVQSLTALLG